MKAIDKALLSRSNDTREEIISDYCPNDIHLNILNPPLYCIKNYDEELCTKCWNREIEEGKQEKKELSFEKLRICPTTDNITINDCYEDNFIKALKFNNIIIYIKEDTELYYDDIPKVIKYLQDIYDYCTELKNKIEYVDWQTARMHMNKGNRCKYKDIEYFIINGELYYDLYSDSNATTLTLSMIDSKEWILL